MNDELPPLPQAEPASQCFVDMIDRGLAVAVEHKDQLVLRKMAQVIDRYLVGVSPDRPLDLRLERALDEMLQAIAPYMLQAARERMPLAASLVRREALNQRA
jgi:hypothetical protein